MEVAGAHAAMLPKRLTRMRQRIGVWARGAGHMVQRRLGGGVMKRVAAQGATGERELLRPQGGQALVHGDHTGQQAPQRVPFAAEVSKVSNSAIMPPHSAHTGFCCATCAARLSRSAVFAASCAACNSG